MHPVYNPFPAQVLQVHLKNGYRQVSKYIHITNSSSVITSLCHHFLKLGNNVPQNYLSFNPSRCRSKKNIKLELKDISWDNMNWTILTQDRNKSQALVNKDTNHQIPYNVEYFSISCRTIGFSSRTLPHIVT